MQAAVFQVRLKSFMDSHKADYKKKKRKTSAQKEPLGGMVKRGIISLFPPAATLTVTFHMFIKIITAGRENPQAVAAPPLEVFHF